MSIKKKVKNYNVLIEEGLRTRQMYPTDILKVDNTDSTDSLWMPQDNANYGTLYASENGIYIAARDGYDAYSEVDVRVTFDDFSDLDIDNLDSTWDLDSLDDLVIDEDLDIDEFDDLFNNEDLWDDPFDKIDSSFDDRVTGIDPISGNEYAVGLDEDGFLDEYLLPEKIRIVKPPNKLTYVHNEKIDYTGIMVMAFSADDKVWKNEKYPEGVIPFEELIFSTEIADATIAENIKYAKSDLDIDLINQPIPFATKELKVGGFTKYHSEGTYDEIEYRYSIDEENITWAKEAITGCLSYHQQQDGHVGYNLCLIVIAGSQQPTESGEWQLVRYIKRYYYSAFDPNTRRLEEKRQQDTKKNIVSYTHNQKTVYYANASLAHNTDSDAYMSPIIDRIDWTSPIYIGLQNNYTDKIAWTIIYGEIIGGVQQVKVQWKRPDGKILEDSLLINVAFPNETLPDYDWNIIDPTIDPHDIPETPEGEVTPEVEVTP